MSGNMTVSGWGNATKDVKFFNEGTDNMVARFSVAFNLRRRDNGKWLDKLVFWTLVAFGGNAKFVKKIYDNNGGSLKGAKVSFSGKVDFSDNAETKARYYSVLVDELDITTSRAASAEDPADSGTSEQSASNSAPDIF